MVHCISVFLSSPVFHRDGLFLFDGSGHLEALQTLKYEMHNYAYMLVRKGILNIFPDVLSGLSHGIGLMLRAVMALLYFASDT